LNWTGKNVAVTGGASLAGTAASRFAIGPNIDDIVEGTIRCAEKIEGVTAVNLGAMARTRVLDAVHVILHRFGAKPRIEAHPEMPIGPLSRVADNALAKKLFGLEPKVPFQERFSRTMDWDLAARNPAEESVVLGRRLAER
jgi:hypothetical protein